MSAAACSATPWQPGKAPPRLFWTPDGQAVRFLAAHRARVHIFEARRDGTVRALVEGDRACGQLQVSRDGRTLVYAAADFLHPHDLYVATPGEGDERRLSRLNPWLDDIALSTPRPIAVTGADGQPVDAWLIPPAGATEPAPARSSSTSMAGRTRSSDIPSSLTCSSWPRRATASSSPIPAPRAATATTLRRCNIGHWGEGDAPDLLAALDAACATGWVDTDRVGVMGLSYGGYMTNWLIGHSDRFRAAISENSISNLVSFYGTADIGWYFLPEEIGAEPDDDLDRYIRLSPLSAAEPDRDPPAPAELPGGLALSHRAGRAALYRAQAAGADGRDGLFPRREPRLPLKWQTPSRASPAGSTCCAGLPPICGSIEQEP